MINNNNERYALSAMPRLTAIGVFIVLMAWGQWGNWVQYSRTCPHAECFYHTGETFSAIYTAIYYQVFGARYWFLQQLPLEANYTVLG
jgi:hypothetical protein